VLSAQASSSSNSNRSKQRVVSEAAHIQAIHLKARLYTQEHEHGMHPEPKMQAEACNQMNQWCTTVAICMM
jgi:hypothetical protein